MSECNNCGGKLFFSPADKGNKCQNCGSVFPIEYEVNFDKNVFVENNAEMKKSDNLLKGINGLKCSACGAQIALAEHQIQVKCPYCNSNQMLDTGVKNIINIDSIIPFAFSKTDALNHFKKKVNSSFYANKQIIKNITENDINGVYINSFVFDIQAHAQYNGLLYYTDTVRDKDGSTRTVTRTRPVSGTIDRFFNNLAVEANSNLEQKELVSIEPYDFSKAVKFKTEFMHGYILEYQDKALDECYKQASKIIYDKLVSLIVSKHNCDSVATLNMNVSHLDRKYNYSLLPVYFINGKIKNKQYRLIMNGQTGKVNKIPKSNVKITMTVLLILGAILGLVLFFIFK